MKKVFIVILSLILVSILGIFLYFKFRFKLEVTLASTLDIPFGVKVNLKNFISESNATFKDKEVSFYELGTNEVKISYVDKYNKEKEYSFNVNVIIRILS